MGGLEQTVSQDADLYYRADWLAPGSGGGPQPGGNARRQCPVHLSRRAVAWLLLAVVAGLAWRPAVELGERGDMYHDMTGIPHMSAGWMPANLFVGRNATTRDAGDKQWAWWTGMKVEIFFTLLGFGATSLCLDAAIARMSRIAWLGVDVRRAQWIKAVAELVLSHLFLWKLFGLHAFVVAFDALLNYALTSVLLVFARRTQSPWARVGLLGVLWAVNLALVLNAETVEKEVVRLCKPLERKIVLAFRHYGLPRLLKPGHLQFNSNFKFVLFRSIDFATLKILAPSASDSEAKGSTRRRRDPLPELLRYMQYCMYVPLV